MPGESARLTLTDLPDEILLMIFGALSGIDAIYSFYGLNERFNRILNDSIIINRLTIVQLVSKHLHTNLMLEWLSLEVLPNFANQIRRFDLDSSWMKDILLAAHYPRLRHLSLHNLTKQSIRTFFTDERISSDILTNQIRTLVLTSDNHDQDSNDIYSYLFYACKNIFTICRHLLDLTFHHSTYRNRHRLFFLDEELLTHFYSSTLLRLKVNIERFDDCLRLLDGRFNRLESVDMNLSYIHWSDLLPNKGILPHLKRFSICCDHITPNFRSTVLYLLYRMSNLEDLNLCLTVERSNGFIDENYLNQRLLPHLPRLNRFTFFIHSFLPLNDPLTSLLLGNIHKITSNSLSKEIISYGDYFSRITQGQFHIYSSPYFNEYFSEITNRFPGGIFNCVRRVSLFDKKPFEHDFFLRIHRSFPFMEELSIKNNKLQYRSRKDIDRNATCIAYENLRTLVLVHAHNDYIEQFLCHRKTSFEQQVSLYVKYEGLERVTRYFTRDQTRINAGKIINLFLFDEYYHSDSLEQYFPHAKIHGKRIFRAED